MVNRMRRVCPQGHSRLRDRQEMDKWRIDYGVQDMQGLSPWVSFELPVSSFELMLMICRVCPQGHLAVEGV